MSFSYIAKDSRLYAVDKDLNVVAYQLTLAVLEYQTAVMRRDFDAADKILPTIPKYDIFYRLEFTDWVIAEISARV